MRRASFFEKLSERRVQIINIFLVGVPTVILAIVGIMSLFPDKSKIDSPMNVYVRAYPQKIPLSASTKFIEYSKKFKKYVKFREEVKNGILTKENIPYNVNPVLKEVLFNDNVEVFSNYLKLNNMLSENPFGFLALKNYINLEIHNDSGLSIENIILDIPKTTFIEIKRKDAELQEKIDKETIELGSFRPQEKVSINLYGTDLRCWTEDIDLLTKDMIRRTKITHKGYSGIGKVLSFDKESQKQTYSYNKYDLILRAKFVFKDIALIYLPIFLIFYFILRIKNKISKRLNGNKQNNISFDGSGTKVTNDEENNAQQIN